MNNLKITKKILNLKLQNFPPKQEHHNFKSKQVQLESFTPFN